MVEELMLALRVGGKTAEARWNDRNSSDNGEQALPPHIPRGQTGDASRQSPPRALNALPTTFSTEEGI